jgi:hypothetical protein
MQGALTSRNLEKSEKLRRGDMGALMRAAPPPAPKRSCVCLALPGRIVPSCMSSLFRDPGLAAWPGRRLGASAPKRPFAAATAHTSSFSSGACPCRSIDVAHPIWVSVDAVRCGARGPIRRTRDVYTLLRNDALSASVRLGDPSRPRSTCVVY